MKNKILNPFIIFIIGAILGILSKLFDIYMVVIGDIFSEYSIWILLGTLISIYSDTKRKAMINVFLFCIGMIITYYLTAHLTHAVYGWAFIKGWTIFAFLSPIFAYFTWMSKENTKFSKLIRFGIIGVSLFCSLFIFNFNIFDIILRLTVKS